MKASTIAPMLILWSVGMLAQGTPTPKKAPARPAKAASKPALKPAIVSGFVFALTEGGDIKPARMAKVYMLYSRPAERPPAQPIDQVSSGVSAEDVFAMEVRNEEAEEKVWEADKPYLKDLTICHATLERVSRGAIVDTLKWGHEHMSEIIFGDTDEDGRFEVTIPPPDLEGASLEPSPTGETAFAPGVYLVVVIGSAGFNDAVWEGEVTVKPGESVTIKMSAPTKACRKFDGD